MRTQIQITDEQARAIHDAMTREGVSMAAVIRRSLDAYLRQSGALSPEDRRQRALAASGKARSGRKDISRRHDAYLLDAFER